VDFKGWAHEKSTSGAVLLSDMAHGAVHWQ
jgi:hypothetical protein